MTFKEKAVPFHSSQMIDLHVTPVQAASPAATRTLMGDKG
jgi:hypothetical protein